MKNMNYLKNQVGEEKAGQIEQSPESFFNANKFRYYQAYAYHRAIPSSILVTMFGVFAIGGYDNSNYIIRKRFPLVAASGFVLFLGFYKIFEFKAGFREEDWKAHNYAKYLLITRNVKVKG